MNTIADRLRERAREIRARLPGYDYALKDANDDAGFLEDLADDLEADEEHAREAFDADLEEQEDTIKDLEAKIEKLELEIKESAAARLNEDPTQRKP